jgi:hypothetical protein
MATQDCRLPKKQAGKPGCFARHWTSTDGRLIMAEAQLALVKDLISTGYFFKELRTYSESKEIDLPSFSRYFAVPYLTRISESYEESGKPDKSQILNLAVKHLSNVSDEELVESIFGLKKIAASEIDANEKALHQSDQLNKSQLRSCRQKSESATSLSKLLVSIIRMFRLAEGKVKLDKSEEGRNSIYEVIKDNWNLSVPSTV